MNVVLVIGVFGAMIICLALGFSIGEKQEIKNNKNIISDCEEIGATSINGVYLNCSRISPKKS